MQDIRFRTGCAVLLSLAAFSGVQGAVAVLLWWAVFAHPVRTLRNCRMMIPAAVLIAFFGIVLEFTGGGGISYIIRMTVILLISSWLWQEYQPGEFLAAGTWLLGDRIGFDLGLVAETGMQSLDLLVRDLERIRRAYAIKTGASGIRSIVPAADILIHGALRRAGETAELMAVRGYAGGGSCCPVPAPPQGDIAAAAVAICMAIIAVVPVSEFFILYH